MCVYTFQLEPVFVFISLKLVKDYIFLIQNNFTILQKMKRRKKCKISFCFDIYTSYVCSYNNSSAGHF